ncbi:MAG TPA: type II secretion system protein GspM [Casimicrobiaceae bacterium]
MPAHLPPALARAWDARSAPQRAVWLAVALAVVTAAVLVLVAAPLSDAIGRTRADVARNRSVLDLARERVAEAASLARVSTPARATDVRAAIDRVFRQEGLGYASADARATEGPIGIVVAGARFDALVRALDTLAREEGVRAVEATITARVEPGTVRAELALTR